MGRPTLTTVNQDSDQYIGLLSFWPFGSADSPTLTDFSGNDATGINTNVTLSSDSYFGTVGEFARSVGDNNDSRFEFSGSPDPGLVTTALTVAAWVKVDWSSIPDGESNNMRILCRRDTTSTVSTMSSGWMTDIEAQGDGTAEFRLIARCASVLAHNNSRLLTAAENNTWLHLCVTWNDGEAPILYVNGDSTGTGGYRRPGVVNVEGKFTLGFDRVADDVAALIGEIAEVTDASKRAVGILVNRRIPKKQVFTPGNVDAENRKQGPSIGATVGDVTQKPLQVATADNSLWSGCLHGIDSYICRPDNRSILRNEPKSNGYSNKSGRNFSKTIRRISRPASAASSSDPSNPSASSNR